MPNKVIARAAAVAPGEMYTDAAGPQPHGIPEAMSKDDIADTIGEYRHAAKLAVEAGFDGVELHGANGYLIDVMVVRANGTVNPDVAVYRHDGGEAWTDLGLPLHGDPRSYSLAASEDAVYVASGYFGEIEGFLTAEKYDSGGWQELGPLAVAGDAAGEVQLVAGPDDRLYASYRSIPADDPWGWQYVVALWNHGSWQELGYVFGGSVGETVHKRSTVLAPNHKPAFAFTRESEYNHDLYVYVPN